MAKGIFSPDVLDSGALYLLKGDMERKVTFVHALEVSNTSLLYLFTQTSAA
jgi:hypothetical protein